MVSGQLWSRRFSLAETKEINKRIADDDDEQPFFYLVPLLISPFAPSSTLICMRADKFSPYFEVKFMFAKACRIRISRLLIDTRGRLRRRRIKRKND